MRNKLSALKVKSQRRGMSEKLEEGAITGVERRWGH